MTNIIEAGIDYLAMTLRGDVSDYSSWYSRCEDALSLLIDYGNVPRVGSFRGYDGIWCAGAFIGQREDGGHIHIAGSWAGKLYAQLYHSQAHYSRFDLQATAQFTTEHNTYAQDMFAVAEEYNLSRSLRNRRKLSLRQDNDGGSTLYIGSRTSEHFCRLYNKAAQSGDEFYARAWRFEVELHNDSATTAATYCFDQPGGQAKVATSTCWRYFNERGVKPPWEREDEYNAVLPRSSPRSDYDRKLAWLKDQVAPSVRLLMEQVPATIVLEALGIGPSAEALPPEPTGEQPTGDTYNGS